MRGSRGARVEAGRRLALAGAAAALFGAAQAQPAGGVAVQGGFSAVQVGNTFRVTTANGARGHSAIDWQAFSVPAGTVTQFVQPSADSLSINRVTGGAASLIDGTLSSNGRLVLVNPAGISIGAGAVVDTAGFTASTLRMADADAIAGRLRLGDGTSAGPLSVAGQVLARKGDVVLVAPDVQAAASALVQAPNGATLLAAGRQLEITGPGLEGIAFAVQAPQDRALNLGRLEGDAVGLFAGTLRHGGQAQALAVGLEGGRVVLKAASELVVDGSITAQRGDQGGLIELSGASLSLAPGRGLDPAISLKRLASTRADMLLTVTSVSIDAKLDLDGALSIDSASSIQVNAPVSAAGSVAMRTADGPIDVRANITATAISLQAGGGNGLSVTGATLKLDPAFGLPLGSLQLTASGIVNLSDVTLHAAAPVITPPVSGAPLSVQVSGRLALASDSGMSSLTVNGDMAIGEGAVLALRFAGAQHDQVTVGGRLGFPAAPTTLAIDTQPSDGTYTVISSATSGGGQPPDVSSNVRGASTRLGSLILTVMAPPAAPSMPPAFTWNQPLATQAPPIPASPSPAPPALAVQDEDCP